MSTGIRYLPSGDVGIVIEVGNEISERVNGIIRKMVHCIKKCRISEIVEIVPAYSSILIIYDPLKACFDDLTAKLNSAFSAIDEAEAPPAETVHIPVLYGGVYGEDIDYVAEYNGLTVQEIVEIHSGRDYLIYMLGFTPGFPYLGGMSEKIAAPRLDVPRERVPGGSVGIAGSQTGIYPVDSPGGWRIIGKTPVPLFDPDGCPVFLLSAGSYIRFEPINEETYHDISLQINEGNYTVKRSLP